MPRRLNIDPLERTSGPRVSKGAGKRHTLKDISSNVERITALRKLMVLLSHTTMRMSSQHDPTSEGAKLS